MVYTLKDHINDVRKCSKLKWNHEPLGEWFHYKVLDMASFLWSIRAYIITKLLRACTRFKQNKMKSAFIHGNQNYTFLARATAWRDLTSLLWSLLSTAIFLDQSARDNYLGYGIKADRHDRRNSPNSFKLKYLVLYLNENFYIYSFEVGGRRRA